MSRIFDIDTNLWRAFKSVSETRSITRSSTLLCKTPPAVSMQIKKLEELLDLQLFQRGDQRFKLTPMGEEVLLTAEKILTMNDSLFRLKEKVDGYELRLGLPDDYSLFFFHEIFKSLKQLPTATRISVTCKTSELLLKDIEQDLLDLVVIAAREGRHLKNAEHIRFEDLCWIGDKKLVNPGKSIPLVHFPQGCVCREISINALKITNIEAHVEFTSDSNFLVFNAINAGAGIGLSERSFVPKAIPVIHSSLLPALPRIEISTVANTQRIPKRVLEQISSCVQKCVNKVSDDYSTKANVAATTILNVAE
ncbi:LysR family transcriptional regulator [Pseudomonas helleri]|uniref:LysR family transcriptional regulator n=1 Tax=Pseudomonas helleri TaxID=1608996 RepID=UPI0028EB32A5|nr:LysR family transcriptional regulator [Pseudomonas helleri]